MSSASSRIVAVRLPARVWHFRNVLIGIADYANRAGWEFTEPPWRLSTYWRRLATSRCDGAIVGWLEQEERALLRESDLPVVCTSERGDAEELPRVVVDSRAIGQAGAEHLHLAGFRNVAFCGIPGHGYSRVRQEGFLAAAAALGLNGFGYEPSRADCTWGQSLAEIQRWIDQLPKPVGVMACNDARGATVLRLCRKLRLDVPNDVAVLGADNDPLICEFSHPRLSSVITSGEAVGRAAGRALDRMIDNSEVPSEGRSVAPGPVVMRDSTAAVPFADPGVRRAVDKVRRNALSPMSLSQILDEIPMSRKTLERRFREALGRTPGQERRRVQMEQVRLLLATTDYPIKTIARETGFPDTRSLGETCRRELGVAPTAYREKRRIEQGLSQAPAQTAKPPG